MKLDFRTKALMTIVISFVLLFGNLQKTYPWGGLVFNGAALYALIK